MFEEYEIWQLAKRQCHDLEILLSNTSLAKDSELRKRMESASSSVLASVSEGYKRPGNPQFQKNFLVIAKSFNSEYGEQLSICFQRRHITEAKHNELHQKNKKLANEILTAVRILQRADINSGFSNEVASQHKTVQS